MSRPFVTIAVPCLDEENFIEACLACALEQDYPAERVEVIVADGGSTDRTRELLDQIALDEPRVRWIDNPGRIQAVGMNAIIEEARGDVVVRFDVHARYAPSYVRTCVEVLERTGADNVGGAQRPLAETGFQQALCMAFNSPLAVGGARYRSEAAEGYVDTVWLGAYRRRVFDEVGGYDEGAVTNEDAELNQRIIEAGGKVYLSPDIEAYYFPRSSFRALAKQYYRYGVGRARTFLKHGHFLRARPLIPFGFVASMTALAIVRPLRPLFAPIAGLYLAACAAEAVRVSEDRRSAATVAAVFPVIHVAHGVGFATGLARYLREPEWADAKGAATTKRPPVETAG